MAFLGSIGKALGIQNLNKGEGWNIARVVFPPIIATELAVAGINKGIDAVSSVGKAKQQVMEQGAPGGNYYIYGGGGYGSQPYGPPPAYSVYFAEPGGPSTWDYSTSSIPFSTPLAGLDSGPISSTSDFNRSWEDLLANSLSR